MLSFSVKGDRNYWHFCWHQIIAITLSNFFCTVKLLIIYKIFKYIARNPEIITFFSKSILAIMSTVFNGAGHRAYSNLKYFMRLIYTPKNDLEGELTVKMYLEVNWKNFWGHYIMDNNYNYLDNHLNLDKMVLLRIELNLFYSTCWTWKFQKLNHK